MTDQRRVAVAMSGGVDSSVAAAILAETDHEVFGLMMRLWSGGPSGTNRCCSPDDVARARQIAAMLGIPFYVLDVQEQFKDQIVDFFVDGYAREGVTPNPCIECNRQIRWTFLLERARAMGATHLATGHYARVRKTDSGYELLRAVDQHKDQSYVLSVMGQHELAHAMFPLGDLTKEQVRAHAQQLELPSADRSDSQDLCFVGDVDYREFLEHQGVELPPPGPIITRDGEVLGEHDGLAFYTIGQRKGIGVSAPHPLYVLEKDVEHNRLVVGPREQLGRREFAVERLNWVSGGAPQGTLEARVQVRYRSDEPIADVEPVGPNGAKVVLAEPMPDVTPGQAAVFYQDDRCLGGGIIQP